MAKLLKITRGQYRALAEVTKRHGFGLNLSMFDRMGCWGLYSGWAELICKDSATDHPQWDERGVVTLAASIDAEGFRAAGAGRPELDWSQLEDHEIVPFIVWHEIGHVRDNFAGVDIMSDVKDAELRAECRRRSRFVNEVLADRFAWKRVRPGEPIPLSDCGKRLQEEVAEGIAFLDRHAPRTTRYKVRPMEPGQYRNVPSEMLATPERASFVGPRVAKTLVEQAQRRHPSLFR